MIVARPVAALAAVDMIAAQATAAVVGMIEAPATAAGAMAVEIGETAVVAEEAIAAVVVAGTKAEEENLPAPGLVRASADAM